MELLARHPVSDQLDVADHDPALPARVYLSRLGSDESINGMVSSLNAVAAVLTGERDWRRVDWRRFLNAAVARRTP